MTWTKRADKDRRDAKAAQTMYMMRSMITMCARQIWTRMRWPGFCLITYLTVPITTQGMNIWWSAIRCEAGPDCGVPGKVHHNVGDADGTILVLRTNKKKERGQDERTGKNLQSFCH